MFRAGLAACSKLFADQYVADNICMNNVLPGFACRSRVERLFLRNLLICEDHHAGANLLLRALPVVEYRRLSKMARRLTRRNIGNRMAAQWLCLKRAVAVQSCAIDRTARDAAGGQR